MRPKSSALAGDTIFLRLALRIKQEDVDNSIFIIMIIKNDHKQTENCLTVIERRHATRRNKPTDVCLRLLFYCGCASKESVGPDRSLPFPLTFRKAN